MRSSRGAEEVILRCWEHFDARPVRVVRPAGAAATPPLPAAPRAELAAALDFATSQTMSKRLSDSDAAAVMTQMVGCAGR